MIKRILKGPVELLKKMIPKPVKHFVKTYVRQPLVQFVRNHTTFGFEIAVKSFLRPSLKNKNIKSCEWTHQQIQENRKLSNRNVKMTVVFLCQYCASWNASMSAFQSALEDPDIDVYLLALPEKILKSGRDKKRSYITHEEYGDNLAFEYCRSFYPDTINAYEAEEGRWFNIGQLKPDYVFIQRPYQMYLPPQYRCNVLAAYTKVCYIPYSYCKQLWDGRSVYRADFMDYVYAVFTENAMYCQMLRKIYCDIFQAKWKKIEYFGYPRFDMHGSVAEKDAEEGKTVLWLPRWTTLSDIEATTFFKYKDMIIRFFKEHSDVKLICRPHPKMFNHFIAIGTMTEEEVGEFKKMFAEMKNFLLDESADYLTVFHEADIFISDTSSLLVEEFSTGKPVIFCGSMWRFDRDAKKWAKHMYPVRNAEELKNRLTALLRGEDPEKGMREKFVRENMKYDGKCGERIIAFLKEDYFSEI